MTVMLPQFWALCALAFCFGQGGNGGGGGLNPWLCDTHKAVFFDMSVSLSEMLNELNSRIELQSH